MIELALVLPVIMLLVAGIVDFGFKINSVKQIATVARHAARIASSHPRRVLLLTEQRALCSSPSENRESGPCPVEPMTAVMTNDSVAGVAYKTACSSLATERMDPSVWNVTSEVRSTIEDGSQFTAVHVAIERIGRDCLICYDRLYEIFQAKTESEFLVEEPCS